jgi:hypothetical protein
MTESAELPRHRTQLITREMIRALRERIASNARATPAHRASETATDERAPSNANKRDRSLDGLPNAAGHV